MSELTAEGVRKLAHLAKLELNSDEIPYYLSQMSQIIDYFSELQNAEDTLSPEALSSTAGGERLQERKDRVERSQSFQLVLESAPKAVGTSFQVPKIIE